MTDIAFVGREQTSTAAAQPQARRREVVVSGRRVKTVDVHAHCAVPEAMALMGMQVAPPTLLTARAQDRIRAMDEQGIDVEALSINPYWYKADQDLARQIITIQNEKLAEACAAHPDRFVAFATVALQHPDLAAQQLEDGVRKYGLRGAAIGGSVNGEELSDPKLHPFWAKAGIRICAAHGGGYLPSYAGRSDAIRATFPDRCPTPIKKKPSEYLRQLYFDSLIFTPEALRHLIAEAGPGQIVVGTDYPYPWTKTAVDHILGTPGLSDADRAAILGETAAKLLGIKT